MASSTPATVLPRNMSCASSTVSSRPRSRSTSASTRLARRSLSTSTPSQSSTRPSGCATLTPGSLLGVEIDERHRGAAEHVLRQHPVPLLHRFPFDQLGIAFERLRADQDGLG